MTNTLTPGSFQSLPGRPLQRGHVHHAQPHVRRYRLVDGRGAPHPVLDDLYDSLEAAWAEASRWWQSHSGCSQDPVEIGVEVSTASGEWRTLRFPGT
ncbi:MAG: hypothetical protein ACRC1L_01980 [Prochlorococcaceae cyanobacterium]